MAKQDPEDFTDMFARFGRDLHLPGMDVDQIVSHYQKNLDALQKSASAAAAGASSLVAKQREIIEEGIREVTELANSFHPAGKPQEIITKQAEFARKSFETTVKNASEVGEIVRQSGMESLDILRKRFQEAIEEIRNSYDGRSGRN